MGTFPVFRHTVEALREGLSSDSVPLSELSSHFLSDPGLLFTLLTYVKDRHPNKDFPLVQSALSVIGQEGIELLLGSIDTIFDEDLNLLWAYSMLLRSAAEVLNLKYSRFEQDIAICTSFIPVGGLLRMLIRHGQLKELLPLLLRLNTEDRIFIQERLFSSNHLREMELLQNMPNIYRGVIFMAGFVFSRDGKRIEELDNPARFSEDYTRYELFKLLEVTEYAAQSILFPQVIEAQERCKEQLKRYFFMTEADFEPYLQEVIEWFESKCADYSMDNLASQVLTEASDFNQGGFGFTTTSIDFGKELDRIYAENREGKNILVWGEPDVGKRLLLASIHQRPDNPNRAMPFISVYCGGISTANFASEFFGAKGGFWGIEKHRGALDIVREGGTVLLKNLDRMPLDSQDMLAATLREGSFFKVGETRPTAFKCRVFITSRSHPLESGLISKSLLEVVRPSILYIPPLRERRQDIEMIADAIIHKYDLPIHDPSLVLGLKEYYQGHPFDHNLLDLKRLLFFTAARHIVGQCPKRSE
jgi:transcriptional regulator with AAA-type ATPase domain